MTKKQAMEADTAPAADEAAADVGVGLPDRIQQLQEAASESYEKLAEAAAQLADQARDVYATSEDLVRQNPGSYVLGAFALGCLLGALLGRD